MMLPPALLNHDAAERLEEIDRPLEVEGHDAVEVLLGVLENRFADIQSRRGDGYVDPREFRFCRRGQRRDVAGQRSIGRYRLGPAAGRSYAGGGRLVAIAIAVGANHPRDESGQRLG